MKEKETSSLDKKVKSLTDEDSPDEKKKRKTMPYLLAAGVGIVALLIYMLFPFNGSNEIDNLAGENTIIIDPNSLIVNKYVENLNLENQDYAVLTLHRPSNVDVPESLVAQIQELSTVS